MGQVVVLVTAFSLVFATVVDLLALLWGATPLNATFAGTYIFCALQLYRLSNIFFEPFPGVKRMVATQVDRLWVFASLLLMQTLGLSLCFIPYFTYSWWAGGGSEGIDVFLVLSWVVAVIFIDDNGKSIARLGYLYQWVCVQPILGSDTAPFFNWYCLATERTLWREIPALEQFSQQIDTLGELPGFCVPDLFCLEQGVHLFVEQRFGYTRLACGVLLLGILSPVEFRSLVAHELAHLAQPRQLREAIGRVLNDVIDFQKNRYRKIFRVMRSIPLLFILLLIPFLLLYIWTQLLAFCLSLSAVLIPSDIKEIERQEELADLAAAELTSNKYLATALIKFCHANGLWQDTYNNHAIRLLRDAVLVNFDEQDAIKEWAVRSAFDDFKRLCDKFAEFYDEDSFLIKSGNGPEWSWNENKGLERLDAIKKLHDISDPLTRYNYNIQDMSLREKTKEEQIAHYRRVCDGMILDEGFRSRVASLIRREELKLRLDQPAVVSADLISVLIRRISKCVTSRSPLELSEHIDLLFKLWPHFQKGLVPSTPATE